MISVFPAWTISASLANFSLPSFSLFLFLPLPVSAFFFLSPDPTMTSPWLQKARPIWRTNSSQSQWQSEWQRREPHTVQTSKSGLLTETPNPRDTPPRPTPPLPTSVWVRMDAEKAAAPQQWKVLPAWDRFSLDDLLTIQTNSEKQWKDNGWLKKKNCTCLKGNYVMDPETQI